MSPKLPGLDAIGCGYQTASGTFASIDSCEEQLFDFDALGYKDLDSTATGKTYSFPKRFVQYLEKNARASETVTGEDVEDFVKKLSTSVGLEASYGGFGGSVKADFSETSGYSRFESYTRLQYNITLWRLSLDDTAGDHRNFLKAEVRKRVDSGDPMDLYAKFGTHYVNDITVGGRCVTSAITSKLKLNKTQSFGVYLTAKFEMGAFSSTADASVTKEEDYKKFTENSKFKTKITGGDPAKYGSDAKPNFEEWANTVRDSPMMVDFDSYQGLLPIWKLAATEKRREELKNAMTDYFQKYKLGFDVDQGPAFEGRWLTGRLQYNDDYSGASRGFAVYRPELTDGWFWLAQRGFGPEYPGTGQTIKVLALKPKPWARDVLCPIQSYKKIWDDTGSSKERAYHIFRPVPEDPVDYVPIGHFFIVDSSDYSFPTEEATKGLMAVHREFVTQGKIGDKMWTDEGTSAYARGSCWKINAPEDGLDCNFFVGHNDYSAPPNADAFCLKKSAIEIK